MAFWVNSLSSFAKLKPGTNIVISADSNGDAVISASGGGGGGSVTSILAGPEIAVSGATGNVTISRNGCFGYFRFDSVTVSNPTAGSYTNFLNGRAVNTTITSPIKAPTYDSTTGTFTINEAGTYRVAFASRMLPSAQDNSFSVRMNRSINNVLIDSIPVFTQQAQQFSSEILHTFAATDTFNIETRVSGGGSGAQYILSTLSIVITRMG